MLILALAAVVTVNAALLAQVSGVVLPLLVALVTKRHAPSWVKAGLLALLSAVAGVVATAIHDNGTIVIHQAVSLGLSAWVTAVASYYGFHKPTGLAGAVAGATSSVGVGGRAPAPEPEPVPEVLERPAGPRTRSTAKSRTGTAKKSTRAAKR